jgi:hypothetical protein
VFRQLLRWWQSTNVTINITQCMTLLCRFWCGSL